MVDLRHARPALVRLFLALDVVEGGQEAVEGMSDVEEAFEGGIALGWVAPVDQVRRLSSAFRFVIALKDVLPSRAARLRHVAEVILQLLGCIQPNLRK